MRFSFAFFIVVLVMGIGTVFAINRVSEGFRIEITQKKEIVAYNDCKNITNQSNFAAVFIPTGSEAEWRDMIAKNPSHLKIEDCMIASTPPRGDGTHTRIEETRDDKWRVVELRAWSPCDNCVWDGVHYRTMTMYLSQQEYDNLSDVWVNHVWIDDWVEWYVNGNSVGIIPYKWNFQWLQLCDKRRGGTVCDEKGVYIGNQDPRRNFLETYIGNTDYLALPSYYRSSERYEQTFPRKNLKDFFRVGENRIDFTHIVGREGEFYMVFKFQYTH